METGQIQDGAAVYWTTTDWRNERIKRGGEIVNCRLSIVNGETAVFNLLYMHTDHLGSTSVMHGQLGEWQCGVGNGRFTPFPSSPKRDKITQSLRPGGRRSRVRGQRPATAGGNDFHIVLVTSKKIQIAMFKYIEKTRFTFILIILFCLLVGCSLREANDMEAPIPTSTIDIPTLSATAVPSIVSVTVVEKNTTIQETQTVPAAQTDFLTPTSTQVPDLSPTSTQTPTSTPLPTVSPLLEEGLNYMLFPVSNKVWIPESNEAVDVPLGMFLSDQPWVSNSPQLLGFAYSGEPRQKNLTILNLASSEFRVLDNEVVDSDTSIVNPEYTTAPLGSPDGNFWAYAFKSDSDPGKHHIAIYDYNAQSTIYVSDPIYLIALSGWSYNSSKLAFLKWQSNQMESLSIIEIVDVTTLSSNELQPQAGVVLENASWSPTSYDMIGYSNDTNFQEDYNNPFGTFSYEKLFLIDAVDGNFELLKDYLLDEPDRELYGGYSGYLMNAHPWSHDGTQIVFSKDGIICMLTLETRHEECLDNLDLQIKNLDGIGGEYPAFSPSGEMIGFVLKYESNVCNPYAAYYLETQILVTSFEYDFDTETVAGNPANCSLFGPTFRRLN